MKLVVSLLINSIAVVLTSYLVPNVSIDSYQTAIIVALVLGLINIFIKPVVKVLTLPINLLSLGIFSLVLNGVFILIVSNLVSGFKVGGFLWAFLYSIVLTIISSLMRIFTK